MHGVGNVLGCTVHCEIGPILTWRVEYKFRPERMETEMPYSEVPAGHTQFGGGPGMIDPQRRKDRVLEGHERLWELYATTTYGPENAHGETDEIRAARAAEIALENDPKTAIIERP